MAGSRAVAGGLRLYLLLLCLRLGCDGVLGSVARLDKCGVCAGDNTSCHIISGIFTRTKLPYGYNRVASLPAGACHINITELRPSSNYLALMRLNGKYVLNGGYQIRNTGEYDGAGTTFKYKRPQSQQNKPESILARGPTNETVQIMLLKQHINQGILYQYTIPMKKNSAGSKKTYRPVTILQRPSYARPSNLALGAAPRRLAPVSVDERRGTSAQYGKDIFYNAQTGHRLRHSRHYRANQHKERLQPGSAGNEDIAGGPYRENRQRVQYLQGAYGQSQPQQQRQGQSLVVYPPVQQGYRGTSQYNTQYTYSQHHRGVQSQVRTRLSPGQKRLYHAQTGNRQSQVYGQTQPNRGQQWSSYQPRRTPQGRYPQYPPALNQQGGSSNYNQQYWSASRGHQHPDRRTVNDQIAVSLSGTNAGPVTNVQSTSEFSWKISGFTTCSRTCGGGVQDTVVVCAKTDSQAIVTDENCDNALKPAIRSVTCNTNPCPPAWHVEEWSVCSTTCDRGRKTRHVECKQRVSASIQLQVSASLCQDLKKPPTTHVCNVNKPCVSWKVGNWTECSAECGRGQRSRQVVCVNAEDNAIPENKCRSAKPASVEICDMGSCAKTWFFTKWSDKCSSECGEGVLKRKVHCTAGKRCSLTQRPPEEKVCMNDLPCGGLWFAGPWGKCNADCGSGHRERHIVCMKKLGRLMAIVGPENCQKKDKPVNQQPCNSAPCREEWFTTDWTECSRSCNTGFKTREVKCLDAQQRTSITCKPEEKPRTRQTCNTFACPRSTTHPTCKDKFKNCRLVIQARLCRYAYYRKICCLSCTSHGHHHET